jgi:hexosaminidase
MAPLLQCLQAYGLLLACTLASTASAQQPVAAGYVPNQRLSVGLWPLPQSSTNGTTTLPVDSLAFAFKLQPGTTATPTLVAATERYTSLIFLHGRGPPPPPTPVQTGAAALSSCSVAVTSATEVLTWGMDESYTLSVTADASCKITATTYVGALYAMETLSQLIQSEGGTLQPHTAGSPHAYSVLNAPWEITDEPRFQYRGLMVDTARHFLPLNTLRRQIDGMSFNKVWAAGKTTTHQTRPTPFSIMAHRIHFSPPALSLSLSLSLSLCRLFNHLIKTL